VFLRKRGNKCRVGIKVDRGMPPLRRCTYNHDCKILQTKSQSTTTGTSTGTYHVWKVNDISRIQSAFVRSILRRHAKIIVLHPISRRLILVKIWLVLVQNPI
jgi:hypothetical protein